MVLFDFVFLSVFVQQTNQRLPFLTLTTKSDKLRNTTLYSDNQVYIIFFTANATTPHIVLESVHVAAIVFYETRDIYGNVLSLFEIECFSVNWHMYFILIF